MKTNLAIIFFVIINAACKEKKDDVSLPSFGGGPIVGSIERTDWLHACSLGEASTASFSAGNYSVNYDYYSDAGCNFATFSVFESGQYTKTEMNSLALGNVDWTLGTLTITPKAASTVTSFNSASYCGFSNWALNTPKNIIGQTCSGYTIPPVGTIMYDIYRIYQSNSPSYVGQLAFGDTDSTYDGTTPAKRPVTVNSFNYQHP